MTLAAAGCTGTEAILGATSCGEADVAFVATAANDDRLSPHFTQNFEVVKISPHEHFSSAELALCATTLGTSLLT